ncbi:peptigoglycan-binding protein LysM, partial [Bacillus toyonensis]
MYFHMQYFIFESYMDVNKKLIMIIYFICANILTLKYLYFHIL